MKIVFTPWYQNNPYQRLLAEALEKKGHTIIPHKPEPPLYLIKFILKNGKPDIIHLHWMHPFLIRKSFIKTFMASALFILEIIILKMMGVKIIWTVHNIVSHKRIHSKVETGAHKILLRLYDHVIHLGRASLNIMHDMNLVSGKMTNKHHITPHGNYVDCYKNEISKATARTLLGIDPDAFVLLCFGTIKPYKGIEIFIKALQEISEQNIFLLIAGHPEDKLAERQISQYCDHDKRIKTFLHFIPDHDIQVFMNAADIVVLPYSDTLNSGVAVLAMSFGKPVIAPNIGSIPEVIDKQGGVLFEPKDKNSLVSAIKKSITLDLESMSQYNFEKAGRFDWNSIASKTSDIYIK
jgi:beta-1,4-mannosyltransferase